MTTLALFFQNCAAPIESDKKNGANSSNPITNPQTSLNQANILFSGHSLIDFLPNFMPAIVTASGSQVQYNYQTIPGSTLYARTRGARDSTFWEEYRTGSNRDTTNMNVVTELLNPQTISNGRYSTLVIAERHDLMGPLQYEDTVRYLRHYHERFIAGNLQGITYFYEAWWNINKNNPTAWINYERSASAAWQCVATRINTSLQGEGRTDRLKSLPATSALAELVEKAIQGTVAGVTGANALQTLNRIFSDDVHTTALGSYYMSLVVYSAVYGKAPVNTNPPAGYSTATATALQTIAWNFIQNYYATNTPLTLSQCRDYFRDSFCSTYSTFAGAGPGNRVSFFTRMDYNNPLYYEAAQDSSYWFAAPP